MKSSSASRVPWLFKDLYSDSIAFCGSLGVSIIIFTNGLEGLSIMSGLAPGSNSAKKVPNIILTSHVFRIEVVIT